MVHGGDRLSEEEAQRVWKRAADLQAARAERPLQSSGVSIESGHAAGYALTQVRDAATEAGIAPEFVALALAEEEEEPNREPLEGVDRWAARLRGTASRSLVVSRRFDRPIDEVHAAVQRVFPRHQLTLVDSQGRALEGGLQVFALPTAAAAATDVVINDLVIRARVEAMHLRLLPLDHQSCLATLSAPLGAARRARLGVGATMTAGGGLVGGWSVGALSSAVVLSLGASAVTATAVIAGAIALGFGAGVRLGVAGSRTIQRSEEGRGITALERLLQTVGTELRNVTPQPPSITE